MICKLFLWGSVKKKCKRKSLTDPTPDFYRVPWFIAYQCSSIHLIENNVDGVLVMLAEIFLYV